MIFDRDCRACPRLASFLDEVNGRYPDYYCAPVPPFGAPDARFLVVGLAPGMHGANRTGRPFTGDHAGILLYRMLHRHGFSTHENSESADDDLRLLDARITNAVKCLPPENKPVGAEINTCNAFLAEELRALPAGSVVMALGGIAHRAIPSSLFALRGSHRRGVPAVPGWGPCRGRRDGPRAAQGAPFATSPAPAGRRAGWGRAIC